jgi:hypothetical protein
LSRLRRRRTSGWSSDHRPAGCFESQEHGLEAAQGDTQFLRKTELGTLRDMTLLGHHHRSPRVLALAALAASPLACVRENPAFDTNEFAEESVGSGDGDGDTGDGDGDSGDGDGDSGDGDGDSGDGDGDSGDGDGDSGDGDGDTGDGDGDTGDGDGDSGDGDGDTGDGDGDGDTGDGDGDGEPMEELCLMQAPVQGFLPFQTYSLGPIDANNAPNFDLAPLNCHLMMICPATQDFCDPMHTYMAKAYSNGATFVGESYNDLQALQIRFHPGGGQCLGASLDLDPSQSFSVQIWNGQFEQFPIRLPCLTDYNVPIYVSEDGSTFWDIELTLPAALWP